MSTTTSYTDGQTGLKIEVSKAEYLGLGPHVRDKEIVISCAFDNASSVTLVLFDKVSGQVKMEIPMPEEEGMGCVRTIALKGIRPNALAYLFRVDGQLTIDPAARLLTGREIYGYRREKKVREDGANQEDKMSAEEPCRCVLPRTGFDWQEDRPLHLLYEEVITYCVHVRGYTKARQAKVRHPGTFKGLEEKIPYLQELGINQVILMPAYEFDELGIQPNGHPMYQKPETAPLTKVNFWGYGTGQYFAPKASYASGKFADLEFKSLVRSMHRAGIEVVMEFAFTDDLDTDYMLQCLSWWLQEYHVDGFVLMTSQGKAQMLASQPLLRRTKLMTGWFDSGAVYSQGRKKSQRYLADLNDGYKNDARRALKGDAGALHDFVTRMRCNERDKAVVNYITGHDGFTLCDLVSYNDKHNEDNGEDGRDGREFELSWNCGVEGITKKRAVNQLRLKQMKNAIALLLCAQGTPMLLGGDELANSQSGNNNPWCQDNEVTWIDWKNQKTQSELFTFVREMIALRKEHPCLRRAAPLTGMTDVAGGFPDFSCHADRAWYVSYEQESRHVGMMLSGANADGRVDYVYIACNFHWEEQEFALPYLPEGMAWKCRIDTGVSQVTQLEQKALWPVHAFQVSGRTVRILEGVRKEQTAERKTSEPKVAKAAITSVAGEEKKA